MLQLVDKLATSLLQTHLCWQVVRFLHVYFIILLCLMPDNFTCQGESAAAHWVVKLEQMSSRTCQLFVVKANKISNRYTHKNAQVVTCLQTSCYKSIHKLCSHCLFLVVVTSLEQAVNNMYKAWWHYQTCYKAVLTSLIQSWYNKNVTSRDEPINRYGR